jgi:hypothetical protein
MSSQLGWQTEAQMALEKEYEIVPNGKSVVQPVVGVTERAEESIGSIGHTVDSATEALKDTLHRTKRSARLAMKTVSEGIRTSTDYLAGKGIVGAIEDVEALIRRYPLQALLIGLSMGYLLSRSRKR